MTFSLSFVPLKFVSGFQFFYLGYFFILKKTIEQEFAASALPQPQPQPMIQMLLFHQWRNLRVCILCYLSIERMLNRFIYLFRASTGSYAEV